MQDDPRLFDKIKLHTIRDSNTNNQSTKLELNQLEVTKFSETVNKLVDVEAISSQRCQ